MFLVILTRTNLVRSFRVFLGREECKHRPECLQGWCGQQMRNFAQCLSTRMGNSGLLWEVAEDVVSSSEIEEFNQVNDRWDSSQLPLSSNANGGVLILKIKERGGESPHAKLSR